jgi:hypothetical protein
MPQQSTINRMNLLVKSNLGNLWKSGISIPILSFFPNVTNITANDLWQRYFEVLLWCDDNGSDKFESAEQPTFEMDFNKRTSHTTSLWPKHHNSSLPMRVLCRPHMLDRLRQGTRFILEKVCFSCKPL